MVPLPAAHLLRLACLQVCIPALPGSGEVGSGRILSLLRQSKDRHIHQPSNAREQNRGAGQQS